MIGIISQDDISTVGHSLFKNFRIALTNYLQTSLQNVNSIDDLSSINTLIIVDEHYIPHKQIWQNDSFINKINEKEIKVLIFNFEKIFNSQFPWNIDIQHSVNKINRKIQLVSDVKDAKILNSSIINKQLLSRDTFLTHPNKEKSDDIVFIGQINEYYPTRNAILNELQLLNNKIKIIKTDRKYGYDEFINVINNAKFILNPLGTGEFINLRFYEAINLNCIVIQQYTDEMLKWYPELNQCNVLKFRTIEDFKELNFNIDLTYSEKYLEDYFEEINLLNIMHII
jgi:hypothetical protein